MRVDSGDETWGAQILFHRLPLGLSFAYIPKGPLKAPKRNSAESTKPGNQFWNEVDRMCRKQRAVFLKIEPDDHFGVIPESFRTSPHHIQPRRTITVDLYGEEDEILARMKQKTRYNIRLATRKGVSVRSSMDIEIFYRLMQTTGERDGFGIHNFRYYQKAYQLFNPTGNCEMLLAEFEGEPIAALMIFRAGRRSWYLYGASAAVHREKMPAYLLQWEGMKWARDQGCVEYDLWGIPDFDHEVLEAEFDQRSNGLWGVYRFKRGFGGTIQRSSGTFDRVYQPLLYLLYLRWVSRGGELGDKAGL